MIYVNYATPVHSDTQQRSLIERMFARAARLTAHLARHVSARGTSLKLFDEVEHVLACLPLSSEEFSIACYRLRNARHASSQGEFGAAGYELKLLAHSLHTRK